MFVNACDLSIGMPNGIVGCIAIGFVEAPMGHWLCRLGRNRAGKKENEERPCQEKPGLAAQQRGGYG